MTPARRHAFWRWSTVLPAVATAVAGTAAAVVIAAPSSPRPASFSDRSPLTALATVRNVPGGLQVTGWSFDPDGARTMLREYARVDGHYRIGTNANRYSSSGVKAHPYAGPYHGFNFVVPVPEGKHRVCVWAANIGKGSDTLTVCTTRTFDYGPYGSIDTPSASHGAVHVGGWVIDNDNVKTPLVTVVTVDGVAHTLTANRWRSTAGKLYPNAGPYHGFAASYAVAQGKHTVCFTVRNIGYGTDRNYGCRSVTLNDSPRGYINSAGQYAGKLRLTGWAFDPDAPTTPLTVSIAVDGTTHAVRAATSRTDLARIYPSAGRYHGFDVSYALAEGTHTVCVTAPNLSYGANVSLGCRTVTLNFTPTASATALTALSTGAKLTGWASDPDTSGPVPVRVTLDGRLVSTVTANGKGGTHSGHNFTAYLVTKSGAHTVCATALNVLYGTRNSAVSCQRITLALRPFGTFDALTRASTAGPLQVTGWALDPDTASPISVTATIDGKAAGTISARNARADVARNYPATGAAHGFSVVLPATDGEHTVCLTARNVGAGSDTSLGCKLIIAVHPKAPSAPSPVTAVPGYVAATISWTAPASDGGAPWTKFVVTASPSGGSVTVGPTVRTATISGLKSNATYTFTVAAVNVAGASPIVRSAVIRTQSGPPPQRTPAPVSTSRYIRNIKGASTAELALMRNEGYADARANPSGHAYLILLDIGGQDNYDGGVVLSATTRFVTYANLVKDVQSYLDGYHAGQRASAPVTVAIGTNNDMEVSATSGKAWADKVVDPLVSYARRYSGMRIAGANDIEPGFRATYSQTKSWLAGYLGATSAPFVFNGSADGCAWTVVNRGCNNGWSMAGLYYLAAGAAPTRMLNLPQIYNTTMAAQWKYISLTGVAGRQPRINFVGTLTEWTACDQTNSCGSLTGHSAWSSMWANLQSDSRLRITSLPYSTDLRIDR